MYWRRAEFSDLDRMERTGTLEKLEEAEFICACCGRGIYPEELYYAIAGEEYCPRCVEKARCFA